MPREAAGSAGWQQGCVPPGRLCGVRGGQDRRAVADTEPSGRSDLPCYMSLVEMKSLFRMQDIVSCATQPVTVLEASARDGTGLADVLQWLKDTFRDPG